MSHAPLSVQLYTVRGAISEDLPGTLARLAGIGFTNVELYDFVTRADQYREALAATGLSAPTAHARLIGTDVDEIFAAAASLGVKTVIDPHIAEERWTTAEGVASIAADLNALVEKAAGYGLSIGYHNHAFEFENRIDGVAAYEVLAAQLDPRILLELDTYWAAVGGDDPAAVLTRLGDKVKFLHVKDGPITKVNEDQLPAGAGAVDITAILTAAPAALRVVELDDYTGDVFDAVTESYRYLTEEISV